MEAVLARNHVESFIDLDAVADPETAWRAGQSDPIDEDIFRRAAAGDEDAAMHVANLMNATGIQAYSEKALAKSLERAKEYARGILAGAGDLLRPTFELGGASVTVEGRNGGFFLVQDGKRLGGGAHYRTLAEAEAAAAGMGAERRGGLVYFTPTNGSWSSHASALIDSPAYGYVMSDSKAAMSLKDNPFSLLRDEKADLTPDEYVERKRALYDRIRLAEAYRDGSDRSAEAEAAHKEWLAEEAVDGTDGFETAAVKAMGRAGIRRLARPNRKNESGFLFMPAALSYGGALYLPYKYLGDLTPVIEDSVETRLKDLGDELFRDPRPGLGDSWRPAARPLVAAMHRALMEVAGETASRSTETVEEAEWLARTFFNPDVYTQEGASHLVTAVTFMRGDDAAFSGGWSGVSAYYATLGLAARRVRATANSNALDSFNSLVGRLAGDPMLSPGTAASSGLVRLAEAYIPDRFKTDPGSLRDLRAEETPFTPVADITQRAAVNLETLVGLARKGIPPGGLRSTTEAGREMEAKRNTAFVQAAQALEGGGNVAVYDEDLPWLLEELYELPPAAEQALDARIEALADDPDADLGAPSVEAVWAGAQARHRSRLGLLPDGTSASMAAQTLRDYPFYVIQMARNMGLSLEVSPGDDRLREKLREIAGWWFGREGLAVPPDSEARFVSDVMEAVPPDTGREGAADGGRLMSPSQREAAEGLDHFMGALDALFGEAEESDLDAGGPADTEGEGDDKKRGQQADWASGLLRRTPEVGFFAAVMGRFFPHAQGHLAAITEALWLRQRGANGTVAPGSLMSLFDEAHWGDPETGSLVHPAFESPEAYADFLEGLPEKDDPVYGEAVAVLKTLGHKGGFVLADRLRGAYRQGIYQVTARIVPENASVGGADFRPLMRSAPASLLQDTKDGLLALARSADSSARIREASDTMRALAGKTPFLGLLEGETEPQRRERAEREIRERLADYGKVLSALLGPGNFVASGLLDPSVADRLTRGLMGGKGKTLSGLLLSAPSARFPAVTVAGYLAERVSGAIGVLTDEREPDPEVRAAAAAAELTRGDMVASLFSRAGAEPLAAVGGFNFLANEIAAMTPVPSASRTGKGLKKVSGECSGRSAFLRAFLDSGDFASMYIAAGGRESDLPYARRAVVWPDGTPVESRVNGVLRRREVSSYEYDDFYDWDSGGYESEGEAAADVEKDVPLPDPEEVKDAAEASHNTGTDPYTHALVYTMDKDTLIVNIPRAAFKSAGLSESPSYGEVVAYAAKALRTHTVNAKRASAWLAAGPSLAVPEARVAVVAPLKDGKLDKAAAEAWHGMYYYGERLGEYYRRQGFETGAGDLMSAKHILAADGPLAPLYVKGQSHPAPSDSDLAAAPDRRFIRDLLAETFTDGQGRERELDALVDLDSLKQSVLTDAAVGGVPLIEYLAENPEAADDTEVALPDGGAVMLGALKNAAGLEVRVIETDGGPAAVFTFVTDLVTQQVGAPGHGARSELRKAATNHVSDCFDLCGTPVFGPLADIQTAYLNAPAVRKAMVDDAVADLDGEEAAVLESALENGAGLGDPRIAALIGVKVAARIAKVIAPKTYGPYAVDKSPNGNIDKDTPAGVRRLHPYRAEADDPLLPDERDRTEAESAAAGGLKRVAADTRFSSTDPFTRYGLRAKPGKFAGAAEVMEAVRILAEAEARASRSGSAADYQAYLATYKNTVLDKFTDGRGGELPPGAVYNFRDLVTEIPDPRGSRLTPDPAAFREIDGTVVISGRLFMTGRTPSGNELRNEWVVRAFEPADTVVADGSRRYTYMKLSESGGKLRLVRAAVPAGMKVTRDEAAGEGSPKVERISGRD
ncbi:MAG: hypothetical protein WC277_06170, partial [Bacilli bacterium]